MRPTTPTSDFYFLRRLAVRDVGGLLGFIVGFLGILPISGAHLTREWLAGHVDRAVFHFILIEFGAAVACGIAGLLLGTALGIVWQARHQRRRDIR